MPNRRNFQRVKFEADAWITCKENNAFKGELLDIALQGALIKANEDLGIALGNNCRLRIYLPASELTMDFEAQLVHSSGDNFGFTFNAKDIETITHLRRLLELNIGSDEEVDREILFWLQHK